MSAPVVAPFASERPAESAGGVLCEALADLRADFQELLYVCRSAADRLTSSAGALERACGDLHAATVDALLPQLQAARSRYGSYARRLLALERRSAPGRDATAAVLAELAAEKAAYAELLRAEQAIVAALVTATDRQSPSFLHSTLPAAGINS